MTTRVFKAIDKKGREAEWSWDETPEVLTALEKLNASPKLEAPQQKEKKRHLKPQMLRAAKAKRRQLINRLLTHPKGGFSSMIGTSKEKSNAC